MAKLVDLLTRLRHLFREILLETGSPRPVINRLRTLVYFLVLVWRGFVTNRCPLRAAALSYTTLLALVPLLAVAVSVSKNFLHTSTEAVVPQLMDRFFQAVTPELESGPAKAEAVAKVQEFIDNINAGALGTVGTIFLVFVSLRLLMTVEQTFNDIWGIQQGRSIWRKIVYYWATVTLGPLLLILALYWTGRAEFFNVVGALKTLPGGEQIFLRLMPFVVLWVAFALLYGLMPNTRVRLPAALVGGIFAGTLWQVNNVLSTLYVSRVAAYGRVYGALGVLPVLLMGLYFSWLIVLFGAQVSYAAQHVRSYLQHRAGERIDQAGRERLACRALAVVCEQFARGLKPPTVDELAERIGAPPQWLNQLLHRLIESGLVARVADDEAGLVPARPPEKISITDVLQAVRHTPGAVDSVSHAPADQRLANLLAELQTAERTAPANRTFAELVSKL